MRAIVTLAAMLLFAFVIAGCSCSSDPAGTSSRTGSLTCTVTWPDRSRVIPVDTERIIVSVYQDDEYIDQQTLIRQPGESTTTCTFTSMPEGTVTVHAGAFDAGSGMLADDTRNVSILPDVGVTPVALRMTPLTGSLAVTEDFTACRMHTLTPWGANVNAVGAGLFPRYNQAGDKIVYCTRSWRGDAGIIGNIFIMDADGSNVTQVTNYTAEDNLHAYYPCFNHAGDKIIFMLHREDGTYIEDLCTIGVDGSGFTNLTNYSTSGRSASGPMSTPDGRIVYCYRPGEYDWDYDLYIMNEDGSNNSHLCGFATGLDIDADVSPDGTMVAFCSFGIDGSNTCQVFTYNLATRDVKRITDDNFMNMCPIFSPDGRKLAYAACKTYDDHSNGYIRLINTDGTGPSYEIPNTFNLWPNSWR